jgi:hypothetical protein
MPDDAPRPAEHLRLSLRLELHLHRNGPQAGWTAELCGAEAGPPLRFASLPALIGYIARLEASPAPGGLR